MNCALCNGRTEEKVVEHREFGILVGRFKAHICMHCQEVFFDEKTVDTIQARSKALGLFGLSSKRTKVAQVGNSLAIRIPKDIATFLKLKKEGEVRIIPTNTKELRIEIEA